MPTTTDKVAEFFTKKVPADWRSGDLDVSSDGEEVVVVIPIEGDVRRLPRAHPRQADEDRR